MSYNPTNPVIVQSDRTVLLEVNNPLYEDARDELARFAELEKSPEYIHTYRITPLSLWNAAAAGATPAGIISSLSRFSKFPLPGNITADITEYISRYGRLKLLWRDDMLVLTSDDKTLLIEVERNKNLQQHLQGRIDAHTLRVDPARRGFIKQGLVLLGYPAEDLAGYVDGAPLHFGLRSRSIRSGLPFAVRDYQMDAVSAFYAQGSYSGGSGVIVLPPGAGKTVVGIGAINAVQAQTLILCPNTVAVRQWITELLDKTDLSPDQIGEYSGDKKEIRPITVTTYQIITYRSQRADRETGELGDFPHFQLFTSQDWGLIIYDEVHLLPAPIFRITAEIQARRRLGLTATLIREDGRETDVFSLIGPKKFDAPWKTLEGAGWIATAECCEIRVDLPPDERLEYALADDNRIKYRISAENPVKYAVMERLVAKHSDDNVLIIGQYLSQLYTISTVFDAPLITGKTPNPERERLYAQFRTGQIKRLVVSRVANFAIDLPDANVAIQVSGLFGSRQEEAQRLGRVLRPKKDGAPAYFYSIVTRDSKDQDFAANRQLFLTEQGYRYTILDAKDVLGADFDLHGFVLQIAGKMGITPQLVRPAVAALPDPNVVEGEARELGPDEVAQLATALDGLTTDGDDGGDEFADYAGLINFGDTDAGNTTAAGYTPQQVAAAEARVAEAKRDLPKPRRGRPPKNPDATATGRDRSHLRVIK